MPMDFLNMPIVDIEKALLYADDIILMIETIEGNRDKFLNGRRLLRAKA